MVLIDFRILVMKEPPFSSDFVSPSSYSSLLFDQLGDSIYTESDVCDHFCLMKFCKYKSKVSNLFFSFGANFLLLGIISVNTHSLMVVLRGAMIYDQS